MWMIIGIFFLMLLIGVPVAFGVGISSMLYLALNGKDLVILTQRIFAGGDSFTLMAIPLFIFAGEIMNACGFSLSNSSILCCKFSVFIVVVSTVTGAVVDSVLLVSSFKPHPVTITVIAEITTVAIINFFFIFHPFIYQSSNKCLTVGHLLAEIRGR